MWPRFEILLSTLYQRCLLLGFASKPSVLFDLMGQFMEEIHKKPPSPEMGSWTTFTDLLRGQWAEEMQLCKFISRLAYDAFLFPKLMTFRVSAALVMLQVCLSHSTSGLTSGLAIGVWSCSAICIFFAHIMRRHVLLVCRYQSYGIQDNWRQVTIRNESSHFMSTRTLLVAPKAWKVWYVSMLFD